MALLVYYLRVRDEPYEVEYRFGEMRDNFDRTLIIDKTTNTVRTEQPEDALFRATAARILFRAGREKAWPPNGVLTA